MRPGLAATAARMPDAEGDGEPGQGKQGEEDADHTPRRRVAEGPDEEDREEEDHRQHGHTHLGDPAQREPHERRTPESPHRLGSPDDARLSRSPIPIDPHP